MSLDPSLSLVERVTKPKGKSGSVVPGTLLHSLRNNSINLGIMQEYPACKAELPCNVPALFSLERDFKVRFKGVDSATPGFWRVIKYDDGRETLECNHPLIPEYLYFFDIWEPSILWRGELDMNNMKILSGEVTTNKKRFGIFPYTETLATFTADIYPPNSDNVPVLDVPNLKDIAIIPPENFDSPYDMKQHPNIFNPEFVEWWFENEDSIANSNQEVKRPKPFWSVTKTQDSSNKKDEKKDRAFGRSKK